MNQHSFVVVLSTSAIQAKGVLPDDHVIEVIEHSVSRSYFTKITGREPFLDDLVTTRKIDCVLSVFGPTWWVPKCPHLCGFALAHIVMPESPFFRKMKLRTRIKSHLNSRIMSFFYHKCSRYYYTENEMISERLRKVLKQTKVYTVTNYYNQVFDHPERWKLSSLPPFLGKTFITLAAPYPHKNLPIAIDISRYLKNKYPDFLFRFVFSIEEKDYPAIDDELRCHFVFIGHVSIEECPSLYQQSDVVFQPTLLECFTAAYPEAMRMGKPIVTTDLSFARGLCGKSAIFYSPLSYQEAAESLYLVSTNESLVQSLVHHGREQLKDFDNYSDRVHKLVSLCELVVSEGSSS